MQQNRENDRPNYIDLLKLFLKAGPIIYPTLIVVQARVQFMAWTWDAICVKDAIVVTVSVPINPNYDTLLDGRKKRNKRFDSNFPIVWALIRLHSW